MLTKDEIENCNKLSSVTIDAYTKSIVSPAAVEHIQSIVTPKVLQIIMRSINRAGGYDSMHPFWNAIAKTYTRISERYKALSWQFKDIKRVIHNDEVIVGDVLVSDYYTGFNFGEVLGGVDPVKISVIGTKDGLLAGKILREENSESLNDIAYFKNEIWYFISHKFTELYPIQR